MNPKYFSEHVEDVMLARLSKQMPGDLPDRYVEPLFKKHYGAIRVAMDKCLWRTDIPGVTSEDLEGYMLLKAHQLLRQGKYDEDRNPYSFFYVAFCHLCLDIARMAKRKHVEQMQHDTLWFVVGRHFDENTMLAGEA